MVGNPPENCPRVTPYIFYRDVAAAVDWLGRAFGFEKKLAMEGEDGTVQHAEMAMADGLVMMGCPGPDYANPAAVGHPTVGILVYVDGVDAHCEHARASGATIVSEPEDKPYGDRMYAADDLEGHRWYFATHVRDVPPDEMQA